MLESEQLTLEVGLVFLELHFELLFQERLYVDVKNGRAELKVFRSQMGSRPDFHDKQNLVVKKVVLELVFFDQGALNFVQVGAVQFVEFAEDLPIRSEHLHSLIHLFFAQLHRVHYAALRVHQHLEQLIRTLIVLHSETLQI